MCPFEILHYLPVVLIALALLSIAYGSKKSYVNVAIMAASLLGLIAGQHMHTIHMEPASFIDPCYGYVVSLLVSTYASIKNFVSIKQVSAS